MEYVGIFKDELQSILDSRPPVSKAKMAQITKAAIKGVKFYKHVVMAVERFISRSRPEYKIPGLYVIDSIVRQSRRQFGKERDVYGPRFSKNLHITFDNLFSGCIPEDKPRIVRVLNLWQKNGVFNSQIIQPLLDMAHPRTAINSVDSNSLGGASNQNHELTDSANSSNAHFKYSKNVLDFDYGEDDDDDAETPTEAEPPLSSTLSKIEMEQRTNRCSEPTTAINNYQQQSMQQISSSQQGNVAMNHLRTNIEPHDPVLERWNRIIRQHNIASPLASSNSTSTPSQTTTINSYPSQNINVASHSRDRYPTQQEPINQSIGDKFAPPPPTPPPCSPPPPPPSLATIYTAPPPIRPSAKPSTDDPDEREAERRRKCFPSIKDRHVTVCSSTLWLGHVPKTVTEAEISDAFGEFGTINSIDLIPPRGCAYVCMDRRQDARKALSKSRGLKLNGTRIKIAWAPGKGLKEYKNLKEFFELENGCAYIPYGKIDSSIDFDVLEKGGVIDEDSMSMEMRESREKKSEEKSSSIQPATQVNIPMPTLPILSQPPPFSIPPPNLNLSIPPPITTWVHNQSMAQSGGLSGIPFPPPVMTNSSGGAGVPPQMTIYDSRDSDSLKSPGSIDQQLSMTEKQINMVEQQLNMIQQAQSMAQPPTSIQSIPPIPSLSSMVRLPPPVMPQVSFQPDPMIFDMPPPPIGGIPIFANAAILGQPPAMLPNSHMNPNQNMDATHMHNYGGGY